MKNLYTVYVMLIRSLFSYANAIWTLNEDTLVQQLKIKERVALRIILGLHPGSNIALFKQTIKEHKYMEDLEDFLVKSRKKILERMEACPQMSNLYRDIVNWKQREKPRIFPVLGYCLSKYL